jgi:hypothetical protein
VRVRGQQCRIQRCTRRPSIDGLCKTHATEEADRLFSLAVREIGYCESGRPTHKGGLQCAHGFSRSYKAVRWDRRNCFALCGGCHTYYTHHPVEWDEWMRERLGHELYTELRALALTHTTPALDLVLGELRAAA